MKVNEGEVPQYYVENSHPAIVSDEVYEEVQLELERRRKQGRQHNSQHCFPGEFTVVAAAACTAARSGIPTTNTDAPSGNATPGSSKKLDAKRRT